MIYFQIYVKLDSESDYSCSDDENSSENFDCLSEQEQEEQNHVDIDIDLQMEANEESDVEMMEIPEESTAFQRVIWQQRLLPYHKEMEEEADNYYSHIKAGLAYSVLMRDSRPGLIYWVHELERFMQLYSFRFTKIDHINILNLLYRALTMKNLDFRVVKVICGTICTLLGRKSLLSRTDLKFDWRPLYDLYIEVVYKNLDEDGLMLLPDDMKKILNSTILECNHFFTDTATQEILDELRPYFCPWDDSFVRGASVLAVFLPTALDHEEHEAFGAKLWVEEFFTWLTNPGTNEKVQEKMLYTLSRLAKDSPGYINFSPYYKHLFTLLLSSLKLELGVDKVTASYSSSHLIGSLTQIIAYSYCREPDNKVQDYISQLFLTLEPYFHPSNTGQHTITLSNFLLKLCASLLYRVGRERYHSKRYRKLIPESMQISDQQIDVFVKSILPSLEYAAFAKVNNSIIPSIIRLLAFLAPGQVIPFVLDLVYPSLQTLTEPHRLTQSLHILACICVPIVRDHPSRSGQGQRLPIKSVEDMDLKSYRKHAIGILNNLLPGLDVNDVGKSTLAFQIITIILLLVPVVDCSQAPQQCKDLTDEEIELCSATASFDCFIDQLMCRIFSMIEMLGTGASERHSLTATKGGGAKNVEEYVIEKGVLTVFRALVRNCSSAFYKQITDRFFDFAKSFVYNSRPAMNTVTKLSASIISVDPDDQFPRFFKFAVSKFRHFYHTGNEHEEEVDHTLIWYASFIADIVRGASGDVLIKHRKEIDEIMAFLMQFKAPNIYKTTAAAIQNILYSLCSIYPYPKSHRKLYDQPFDQYLPIRHWAEKIDKDKWSLEWHIPTDDEVDYASQLIEELVTDPLKKLLENAKDVTDKEMLRILTIARYALEGCSNLIPFFDGPHLSLIPMAVPNYVFDATTVPSSVKRITAANGENYRRVLYNVIKELSDLVLKERENDTKSSLEIMNILRILLHVQGCEASSFNMQFSTFQTTKRVLADALRGYKETIETVMEGTVALMHTKRILHRPLVGITATHVDAFNLLLRFATSLYSVVRLEAQKLLETSFVWWSFSYKLIIDRVLPMLKEPQSYEQFKGALYILINGKEASILVRQDWESISKMWPVLCLTQSPEAGKQTIINLLDIARDLIINNFSSFQIKFKFPHEIFPFAHKLLEDYDGNIHTDPIKIPNGSIQASATREASLNEANTGKYFALADSLLQISMNKEHHWRHVDFAQALMSLLLRRDAKLPDPIVQHFFRLVVSDSIKTRKMAIGFCGTWMKINRKKAEKTYEAIRESNLGPGAKWPIQYGVRKDNRFLLYDEEKKPITEEEWDETRFLHKPHWGFYIWPEQLPLYAPPNKQFWANRTFEEFTPIETAIVELLKNSEYRSKFSSLYSLEEKKGHEEFDPCNYLFFYRIFRSFNDVLLPEFFEILAPLLKDTRESHQRLAAEIVAGMVCGAKLWQHKKQKQLIEWLCPRLQQTFTEITQETEKNWGTCLATIFGVCEPRQVAWMIDMLFALINKPTEISFHIKTRLYLLHCALNQSEWRVPAQWRKLAEHCLKMVDNMFQNVRLRVGSCLATTAFCDFKGIYVDPELNGYFKMVTVNEIVNRINELLEPLWKETLTSEDDQRVQHVDSSSSLSEMALFTPEHKTEKLKMITLVNFLYSLTAQFSSSVDTSAIQLIPILAHYSNVSDNTDEELKNGCISYIVRTLGLSKIEDNQIDILFKTCNLVREHAVWWKSKITLLRFLQVFAFSNLFMLCENKQSIEQLRELIMRLMVDSRFEVRVASAETLSGLVRAGILKVEAELLENAKQLATSRAPIQRHAGVLALAAIVLAFPYSVPAFLPEVLMRLCNHASEPQPIFGTVKRALSDFKRTHQDEWHTHKLEFSEDQLQILTNLIVSPNYYV